MNNIDKSACKVAVLSGATFALLSVAAGAFAAHALKAMLSDYQLGIFETAAKYQMYHGLALILVGLFGMLSAAKLWLINLGLIGGIVCFSGSLYFFALFEIRWLVYITPLGGLLLLFGWAVFLYQAATILSWQGGKAE